jgi:uncharacterized membrane protein YhhN
MPVAVPGKIALPLLLLSIVGLWLLPWQMCMAMIFSAAGDYAGSCGSFIFQMGFFAVAHIFIIAYFIRRYLQKVEHDGKLTAKAKGYLVMLGICIGVLLLLTLAKIAPAAPAGVIRAGVCIYTAVICTMLLTAMLQRSSLFALGAVLLVFSDFILAWNLFVEPIPGENLLIMIPYYLGQWLLFVRATSYRVKTPLRLMRF